jgi:YYY domain-containing protein
MLSFILWVFVMLLLGTAAFPITFWLFPHLSDRGYGVAKPAGLLFFGFLYWILVTFRILPNNRAGVATVFALVVLLGCLAAWKTGWSSLISWYSDNRWFVVLVEAAFILLFAFLAFMRAASPDIIGTEKPMELAFINSILHSQAFPPADPWLSGYAISYYYFGYVIVAGLIRLTGVLSGVGFNLAIALWFSMGGLGIFSVVLNILSKLSGKLASGKKDGSFTRFAGWAALGPLFLIFLGNWEGLFELLHSLGLGNAGFWTWLDLKELTDAPTQFLGWLPSRPSGIWWWRASRVIQDHNLVSKDPIEVIDEFPFFSLYLSDLHPHVLSIPFVLLAASLALELFFRASEGKAFRPGWYDRVVGWLGGQKPDAYASDQFLPAGTFWVCALIFGALAFMNIWDFPIYVGLACVGIALARYLSHGWNRDRWIEFFESGLAFGLAGVLLFIPFYVGFSSQAGGLLPGLVFYSPGKHLWIMFGVLWVPVFAGLLVSFTGRSEGSAFMAGIKKASLLVGGLWAAMLLLGLLITIVPDIVSLILPKKAMELSALVGQFFNLQGSNNRFDLLLNTSIERILAPGGWLTLMVLLALVWGGAIILRRPIRFDQQAGEAGKNRNVGNVDSFPFVLAITALATGLVVFTEFFYLRDQFGTRMNTVFKFYYQAWILWSIAAAVFMFIFFKHINTPVKVLGSVLILVSIVAGMLYPFYGFYDRFSGLAPSRITLDGNAYFSLAYPDEISAIEYLHNAPDGTVAEAVGGSYTGYARVATLSGQSNVIGWPGHESQWRGGAFEIGTREQDIRQLYQTANWPEALTIIQKYHIRYIYIGSLEKSTYRVSESKFSSNLPVAYNNSTVTIYEVPVSLLYPEQTTVP